MFFCLFFILKKPSPLPESVPKFGEMLWLDRPQTPQCCALALQCHLNLSPLSILQGSQEWLANWMIDCHSCNFNSWKKQDQFALPEPKTKRRKDKLSLWFQRSMSVPARAPRAAPARGARAPPVPLSGARAPGAPAPLDVQLKKGIDAFKRRPTTSTDFWESPNFLIFRFVCFDFLVFWPTFWKLWFQFSQEIGFMCSQRYCLRKTSS